MTKLFGLDTEVLTKHEESIAQLWVCPNCLVHTKHLGCCAGHDWNQCPLCFGVFITKTKIVELN